MNKKIVYFKNVLETPYMMHMLHWRNQEYVRENMLDNRPISENQHEKYLEILKNTPLQKVFIAFYQDEPIAVMTMKHHDDFIETGSYLIHEEDMVKGFGVITGFARMEYVFACMPKGEMRTVILGHNKKNLSLQKNFGCELREVSEIDKSDGTKEILYLYTMTKPSWDLKKEKIQRMINRLVPIEKIQWIEP